MSAGLIFAAFGAAFLGASFQYEIGSPRQMGPGFLPCVLSALLVVLGLAQMLQSSLRARRRTRSDAVAPRLYFRPAIFVLGGLAVFAAALERLGFVAATLLLVASAAVVTPDRRWVEAVVTAGALVILSTVLFVKLLGVPMPVWPAW